MAERADRSGSEPRLDGSLLLAFGGGIGIMDTPPDPEIKATGLEESKSKLRQIAKRDPWPLRLLDARKGVLFEAFLLGLAAGGYKPGRKWVKKRLRRHISGS